MSTLLAVIYALILASVAIFEIHTKRKTGFPLILIAAEGCVYALLLANVFVFYFAISAPLQQVWQVLTPLVAGANVALQGIDIKNGYESGDWTKTRSLGDCLLALAFGIACVAPSITMGLVAAYPDGIATTTVATLIAAVLLGGAIAIATPRFGSVAMAVRQSVIDNHRQKLLHWLSSPDQYGRAPDNIFYLDMRKRRWPVTDGKQEVICALFRFNYGSKSAIGIAGPFEFSSTFTAKEGFESMYGEFERFYLEIMREKADITAMVEGMIE